MLLFSDSAVPGGLDGISRDLAQANFMHFVDVSRISCAVLRTERIQSSPQRQEDALQGMQFSDSGCWFTLHGPRVCWNRRVHVVRPEGAAQEGSPAAKGGDAVSEGKLSVVGSADGLEVVDALISGRAATYLSVTVSLKGALLPRQVISDGPWRIEPPKTQAVAHLFGRRFVSGAATTSMGTLEVEYAFEFEAKIPMPSDTRALASLDDCELSLDIVDAAAEGERRPVLWAARIPLWRLLSRELQPAEAGSAPPLLKRAAKGTSMTESFSGGPMKGAMNNDK